MDYGEKREKGKEKRKKEKKGKEKKKKNTVLKFRVDIGLNGNT